MFRIPQSLTRPLEMGQSVRQRGLWRNQLLSGPIWKLKSGSHGDANKQSFEDISGGAHEERHFHVGAIEHHIHGASEVFKNLSAGPRSHRIERIGCYRKCVVENLVQSLETQFSPLFAH